MRLGRVVAALPVVAIGLAVWRHAQWVVSPENAGQDGTCAGIEELLSYALAIATFGLALIVLLKGLPLRGLIRLVAIGDAEPGERSLPEATDAGGRREPRPLHPSEDTTSLFD